MPNVSRLILIPLFVGLMAFSAFEARAQSSGGFGGGRMSRGDHSSSRSGTGERSPKAADTDNADQVIDRLARLREDLKLAPGQEEAWQHFSDSLLAYMSDLAREQARPQEGVNAESGADAGLTHIRRVVDTARNRLTALETIEASAGVLYRSLTVEQKRLADTRLQNIVLLAPRRRSNDDVVGPAGQRGSADNLPDIGGRSTR